MKIFQQPLVMATFFFFLFCFSFLKIFLRFVNISSISIVQAGVQSESAVPRTKALLTSSALTYQIIAGCKQTPALSAKYFCVSMQLCPPYWLPTSVQYARRCETHVCDKKKYICFFSSSKVDFMHSHSLFYRYFSESYSVTDTSKTVSENKDQRKLCLPIPPSIWTNIRPDHFY